MADEIIDGTKPLTREQLTKLYMATGDKRFLSKDGKKVRKRTPAVLRRLPGEVKIKMPTPTAAEQAKRKKLVKELKVLTGNPKYNGVANLPPSHVGSRWHKITNRRPQY